MCPTHRIEKQPIRVLVAEDSEDDALLLARELNRGGYDPHMLRVDSADRMRTALQSQVWDVIIADHNMPSFDSSEALALAREYDHNIPFILVSGSIGEEVAVDAMKSGAHDYVMKNNLARLLPAMERELREADTRRAHQAAEATIRHMAYHDSLTGLVNRVEFERRIATAVESACVDGQAHALLYLDLDQFKLVNDSCGHLAGDELLRQMARRLQNAIRGSDTLARLGGDEFGVLLTNCPLPRAERIAGGLLDAVRAFRFVWSDRTFNVGASIGLVRVDGKTDAAELLSLADMSCYAAKDRGRNRTHIYAEGDAELSQRQGEMQWVQRLQSAMENNDLLLYRQRIQGLQQSVSHNELLLRMRDEYGGIITPDRFIPAAERYNLMPVIDRWVIQHACGQLERLHKDVKSTAHHGSVFINLSATSLNDDGLAEFVREQLNDHDIPSSCVGFEITETAAIADLDRAINLIEGLRRQGCRVALDDFGTGMCSFSYLKSLVVDFIKIDGSFVRAMLENEMDNAIVAAINNIGHIAGIETVAEFVETDSIAHRLKEMGIDYAQGWAIERPHPFAA